MIELPCPKYDLVLAPSKKVSVPFGSRIKAKLSVPFFIKRYVHPSRVELQAGRVRVISAVRVPT